VRIQDSLLPNLVGSLASEGSGKDEDDLVLRAAAPLKDVLQHPRELDSSECLPDLFLEFAVNCVPGVLAELDMATERPVKQLPRRVRFLRHQESAITWSPDHHYRLDDLASGFHRYVVSRRAEVAGKPSLIAVLSAWESVRSGAMTVPTWGSDAPLTIKEAVYGPDHPEVALTLTNLGITQMQLDNLAAARATLERSLIIKKTAYGANHPQVALTLTNLGAVQLALDEPRAARATYQQALDIFESAYGPDHPNVRAIRTALRSSLRRADQQRKAFSLFTGPQVAS
jgi:tetratricopeptide (TPR) repeat protein